MPTPASTRATHPGILLLATVVCCTFLAATKAELNGGNKAWKPPVLLNTFEMVSTLNWPGWEVTTNGANTAPVTFTRSGDYLSIYYKAQVCLMSMELAELWRVNIQCMDFNAAEGHCDKSNLRLLPCDSVPQIASHHPLTHHLIILM